MLHPFLVFDVLLNHFEWSTTNRRDKVGVGPKGRESRLEPGILLAHQARRPRLDRTHQAVNTVLGIDFHQEVDVFGHDFQFKNLGIRFSADALNNLFKPVVNAIDQHSASVLGTPDNVIFTGVDHVVVRFVLNAIGYHAMKYIPYGCITQEKARVLRTRGALTPYLKLGGCGAVLLNQ
jgi:hypothetical protein